MKYQLAAAIIGTGFMGKKYAEILHGLVDNIILCSNDSETGKALYERFYLWRPARKRGIFRVLRRRFAKKRDRLLLSLSYRKQKAVNLSNLGQLRCDFCQLRRIRKPCGRRGEIHTGLKINSERGCHIKQSPLFLFI